MSAGEDVALVCFALPQEAKPVRRRLLHLPSIRLLVTGMGQRNTERALDAALAEVRPALVLTCGFAGALDPLLPLSATLFETSDPPLAKRFIAAGWKAARFHCATRMAVTAAEKAALRRETSADAVEMESAHVHRLCRAAGISCATARVISDVAGEDMPLDFNAVATPELKLDFGKLALAVAKSPRKIPDLLRLQRQTAAAAEALSDGLVRLLRS